MQTPNQFLLTYPLITDQILSKGTAILSILGHKLTEWEEEAFNHPTKGFIRTPRIRCKVQNCDDVFGLYESNYPRCVILLYFCHIPGTKRDVTIYNLLLDVDRTTIDEIRTVTHSSGHSHVTGVELLGRACCIRYRNFK